MKKLMIIFAVLIFFCLPAKAQDVNEILDQQYKDSGADEINREVPNNIQDELNKYAGKTTTPQNIGDALNFDNFVKFVTEKFFSIFKTESSLMLTILAIIILNMLFESLYNSYSIKNLDNITNAVIIMCLILAISVSLFGSVKASADAIKQMAIFGRALIPVMCGLMITSGQPVSAGTYNTFLFLACQVCAYIGESVILPLVNIYFASIICEGIITNVKLKSFTEFIKKLINWGMGILFTVFIGIMTLQSVISGAADTVAKRAVKFAVGALMPIAGGVLGDAMDSVFSCANTAKSLTGVFGIVTIVFIIITPLLSVVSKFLVLQICSWASEALGGKRLASFLSNTASAFSILISLTLGTSIMLIASFTLLLLTGVPK